MTRAARVDAGPVWPVVGLRGEIDLSGVTAWTVVEVLPDGDPSEDLEEPS